MSRDYYCYLTAYLFYGSPRSSMYFLDPRSDARATAVAVSHSHLSVWRVGPFASKGDVQRFVHRARETRNGVQQRLSPAQEVELELYVAQARAQVDALPIADALSGRWRIASNMGLTAEAAFAPSLPSV